MEIENVVKKSWNFSTAYHESRTSRSDIIPYKNRPNAMIWLWEGFGLLTRFQIVLLSTKAVDRPSFRLPIFSLKLDLTFFSCTVRDEYAQMIFWVCLPGITENRVNCHGILLSDLCGNPVDYLGKHFFLQIKSLTTDY